MGMATWRGCSCPTNTDGLLSHSTNCPQGQRGHWWEQAIEDAVRREREAIQMLLEDKADSLGDSSSARMLRTLVRKIDERGLRGR